MGKYFVINESERQKEYKATLLLFPFAGSGTTVYKDWGLQLENIKVISVLLPGRESRFMESPINKIDILVENIFEEVINRIDLDMPLFFFGHSMGTKIVFELVVKMGNEGIKSPTAIILSGGKAPCYISNKITYNLPNSQFVERLREFSGTPEEVLQNKDLLGLLLPMLRADFEIDETYTYHQKAKIKSDILVLMGKNDLEIKEEEAKKWKNYTEGRFYYEEIEGDHMFIVKKNREVLKKVEMFIEKILRNKFL